MEDEFEEDLNLIPLTLTIIKHETLSTRISLFTGISLITTSVIGSGIFASPQNVFVYSKSVAAALCIWLLAAFLSFLGALSYAELGSLFPNNGGDFLYLLKAFGEIPAFLFSFSGITVTRPGTIAIVSLVFADYFCKLIYQDSILLSKTIAILCIILVTIINATSNNLGAFVSNLFLILKISSVTIICLFGFSTLVKSQLSSDLFADSSTEIGDYALALFYALFAYDGWNNLNLVSGELRNPSKNIPLALSISMLIITICYILVNVAFYTVIPKDILLSSTSIALDFGKIVFGHFGKLIICLSVLASTFGTLNASIFTAARIVHTSALSGHAPKIFSKLSNQDTPINSILQQCVFSIGFVIVGNFNQLVNFYSIIAWSFYFLTVLGLVVLRFKEPLLDRPFKVWFIIPILFCASSLFLVVVSVFEAPIEAIAALIFQLFGLIIWFIVFYQKRRILDRLDWFIGMVDRVRGGYQATNQDETN